LWATPPIQPGISFVKNRLRLLLTDDAATVSPVSFADTYIEAFGALPVAGQKAVFQARVIDGATGATSVPLQSSLIPE
jgi:hypothetical protein